MDFDKFKEWIKPLSDKVENMLKFGRYTRVIGQDGQLQQINLKTLRNIENAVKMGQFGFNSKAPIDSRVVLARIGNDKVVIANEHLASILDVTSGNSIVYNQDGNFMKIVDSTITVKAPNIVHNCSSFTVNASTKATFNTPLTEFSDDVNVLGLLSASSYSGLGGSNMTTNVTLETSQDVRIQGKAVNGHDHNGQVPGF